MAGSPLDATVTSLTHAIVNDVSALSTLAGPSAEVLAVLYTTVTDITALSVMTQLAVDENRELKLELERARMATEDARGAMFSNFPAPGYYGPFQTWRDFANRIYREYDHLTNGVLVTAGAMISQARADIRVVTATNWGDMSDIRVIADMIRQAALAGALTDSYNVLTDVERPVS